MLYRVNELAKVCGVSPDTIRHYTKIGLLKPSRNPENDYRLYTTNDSIRISFIRKAKILGFSLKEIEQILDESQKGHSPCLLVRDLIAHRISVNRARLDHLMGLQKRMEQAIAVWSSLPDGIPDGDNICYLIEAFADPKQKFPQNEICLFSNE